MNYLDSSHVKNAMQAGEFEKLEKLDNELRRSHLDMSKLIDKNKFVLNEHIEIIKDYLEKMNKFTLLSFNILLNLFIKDAKNLLDYD